MMHTQGVDMTHGPLSRKIWLMAIPLALTGVIQQFFNAADIAMIGRFVDEQSMAAVGGCAPLITTLLSLFIGLSIGTNVVLAGFIGQDKPDKVRDGVHTSVTMAFLCGLAFTLIGEMAARPMLLWLQVPAEIMDIAEIYLRIPDTSSGPRPGRHLQDSSQPGHPSRLSWRSRWSRYRLHCGQPDQCPVPSLETSSHGQHASRELSPAHYAQRHCSTNPENRSPGRTSGHRILPVQPHNPDST